MTPALVAAIVAATQFWGGPPPCTPVHHVRAELPRDVIGMAHPRTCKVVYSKRIRKASTLRLVIIHEYGHLHGHHHSRNPRSVMFWKIQR